MKMNKKRGQVTLFIILGIVLVLIVVLALFVRKIIVQEEPPEPVITTDVPAEIKPVQEFTEQCVYSVAKEGLIRLGQQGGYINTTIYGIIPNNLMPTSANGIEFAPDSGLVIPYWYYMKSPNTCQGGCMFDSKKPPLYRRDGDKSVESQMDLYILENLPECTKSYSVFCQK